MGQEKRQTALFLPVRLDLQCVLFFKTRPPIDPVDFVHRICKEIVSNPSIRRMRYVNRLTPVSFIGKATEKGIEEVATAVLAECFNLSVSKDEKEPNNGRSAYFAKIDELENCSVSAGTCVQTQCGRL
jgi:tRNA acetyltransferase TAN1